MSEAHLLHYQVIDVVDIFLDSRPVVEARECLLEPVCAFAAWDTPSAAFMLVELHYAQCEFDHAGVFVAYDHTARAQEAAGLGERVEVEIDGGGFVRGEQIC